MFGLRLETLLLSQAKQATYSQVDLHILQAKKFNESPQAKSSTAAKMNLTRAMETKPYPAIVKNAAVCDGLHNWETI